MILDNDVIRLAIDALGHDLNLFDAVRLVVDGGNDRQRGIELAESIEHVHLREEIEKDVGRGGTAVHDNQGVRVQFRKQFVNRSGLGQVNERHVRVEPFQRRVFVVGVYGQMRRGTILQILDEIDSEETFPDAALAVENQIDSFLSAVSFHKVLKVFDASDSRAASRCGGRNGWRRFAIDGWPLRRPVRLRPLIKAAIPSSPLRFESDAVKLADSLPRRFDRMPLENFGDGHECRTPASEVADFLFERLKVPEPDALRLKAANG